MHTSDHADLNRQGETGHQNCDKIIPPEAEHYRWSLRLGAPKISQMPNGSEKESKILGILTSLVAQLLKNPAAMQDTWVWSLGQVDLLEKEMETHSSILAWEIPWTESFSSVQFSHSVVSNSLWPHELQHTRPLVHHQLPESTQIHIHWVGDAIQPFHPLLSPSPPARNLSHHQGLFKWVSSSHQVAKVLEFQLQHQSFQWTPRTDLL